MKTKNLKTLGLGLLGSLCIVGCNSYENNTSASSLSLSENNNSRQTSTNLETNNLQEGCGGLNIGRHDDLHLTSDESNNINSILALEEEKQKAIKRAEKAIQCLGTQIIRIKNKEFGPRIGQEEGKQIKEIETTIVKESIKKISLLMGLVNAEKGSDEELNIALKIKRDNLDLYSLRMSENEKVEAEKKARQEANDLISLSRKQQIKCLEEEVSLDMNVLIKMGDIKTDYINAYL